jgi:hypothetical protein
MHVQRESPEEFKGTDERSCASLPTQPAGPALLLQATRSSLAHDKHHTFESSTQLGALHAMSLLLELLNAHLMSQSQG